MAFREPDKNGKIYAPGWFLADNEGCTRLTQTIDSTDERVVTVGTGKYLPMGTIWPSNNSSAKGIVYEDVDVTEGNMPGSVVMKGVVYENRLPAAIDSNAKTALIARGFVFISSDGSVTRPDDGTGEMDEITVSSAAGTGTGNTEITVSGYTPGTGESYVYKTDSTTAPTIAYMAIPDYTWTAWDGTSDIASTTGYKITIVSVNSDGRAVAMGSDDVVTA